MEIKDFSKRILASTISNYLSQKVFLCGWIKKIRKLGKLIFIDLRDYSGVVQLVLSSNLTDFVANKSKLSKESTIAISGTVKKRKNINQNLPTGEYEVDVDQIRVFSTAEDLPMIIDNETDAMENVRLKYRFLDLRRPCMREMLKKRFDFTLAIREFFSQEDFIEIETPYLTKPTPEGARDYVVPTRLGANFFYALSQSPQLYKQLLMVAGIERYFQIARCFRDEDARSDRQPEHTQLDMEMSFVGEKEVRNCVERLVQYVSKKVFNVNVSTPFEQISYFDAMNLYGSDKPDLRYELKLFEEKENLVKIYQKLLNLTNITVKMIFLPGYKIEDSFLKIARKCARDNSGTLHWITFHDQKMLSSFPEALHQEIDLKKCLNACSSPLINIGTFFVVGNQAEEIVNKSLGSIRTALFENYRDRFPPLKSIKDQFKFCWIVDWPLFVTEKVLDSTLSTPTKKVYVEKIVSAHNPFTKPREETLSYLGTDPLSVRAHSYDLVLNGKELGSGAIRNFEPAIQKKIFGILGLNPDEISQRFGFLLNAYRFGSPQHAGIGIGIDRWLSIMLNLPSIKDVIAFPKTNQGIELLSGSPTAVDEATLKDIFIRVIKK